MVDITTKDLENLSAEELELLQSKIKVAQAKKRLGSKYRIHKAIEDMVSNCQMPPRYQEYAESLKQLEPSEIVPSILDNDQILRFPFLMTLACYLPISAIALRCGLVELFDSFVYHNGPGDTLSGVVRFDVDTVMRACQSHDDEMAAYSLDEQYRRISGIINSPATGGSAEIKLWVKRLADDLMFLIHVIMGRNVTNRFYMSTAFLLPGANLSGLNTEETHKKLVDQVLSDGSDLMYARKISNCFKLS